jgi:hypothetical protein
MNNEKRYEHFDGVNENQIPKTTGCEECQKEGTDWVALRMCLIVPTLVVAILQLVFMQQSTTRKPNIL